MLKAKLFLVATVLFVLCNVVVAQSEYYVRPKSVTNLRAEPSLGSSVVGRARAGQILQVVGEEDDWLKVNSSHQTAWIAGWLDYTVLGKDGPFEIMSAVGGMTCDKGPQLRNGAWLIADMDCELDLRPPEGLLPAHMREIPVEGPERIVSRVNSALSRLQEKAPEWYAYVVEAVDKIIGYETGSSLDTVSGQAYVYPHLRTMYISAHAAAGAGGLLEGIMVHEACHVYEYDARLTLVSYESEVMCHTMEMYALEALGGARLGSVEGTIKFLLFLGE